MRSFKALWRLAVNRREDRFASRPDDTASGAGRDPRIRERNDKTAALLNSEPPTRTLQ